MTAKHLNPFQETDPECTVLWNMLVTQCTRYQAADIDMQRAIRKFAIRPPVDIRNKAREHLWQDQNLGAAD